MSLQVLLRCSDEVFESRIRDLDQRHLIDVMNGIIAEMDKEQTKFDRLSSQIKLIMDQTSAEFKDISTELIKSQNRLALLMARNMLCFNLQNEEESHVQTAPIVVKQVKPTRTESRGNSVATSAAPKKKIVKVTRVITRKVITDADTLDPQLKSLMESRRNKIKNYKKPSVESALSGDPVNSSQSGSTTSHKASTVNGHNGNTINSGAAAATPHSNGNITPPPPTEATARNGTGYADLAITPTDDPIPVSDIDSLISSTHDESVHRLIQGQEVTSSPRAVGSAASSDTDTSSSATAIDLAFDFNSNDFEPEKVKERIFMKLWNPVKILNELYTIRLAKEPKSIASDDVINIEGYLEQLPVGKKKSTLLKTWRRVYCRAKDGIIYFYKSKNKDSDSSSFLSVMGGALEEFSNGMIGIDDQRGHYLMIRCPSETEHRDWLRSLYTQVRCSATANYIRPTLTSSPHPSRVVVVDLGSCSVRAGVLGTTPSYPQLFFPCITSSDSSGRRVFGNDSYDPEKRANGLQYPVATNPKVDKYRINVEVLYDMFRHIFEQLGVVCSEYSVLLSTPHNFSSRLKEEVLNVLFKRLQVKSANVVNQSLLTPYIYNATSGIVVDIGERIDIVAITDGYLVQGGTCRRSFGGSRVTDNLNSSLIEYRLFTPVEHLITRLIKEKTCFVSQDYEDDLLECMGDNTQCQATVDLEQFSLPEGAHLKLITVDSARFKAPEGLIRSELMGVDSPTLPQLIQQAVAKCPMDLRREMWQSIYLSGGTTLLEGFAERLEAELLKIVPTSIIVKVHASAHRYHAAYIGACMLAKSPNFTQSCITREEWLNGGKATLNKWKYYFQGS